jgi:sugar lactone lactonase YvrE
MGKKPFKRRRDLDVGRTMVRIAIAFAAILVVVAQASGTDRVSVSLSATPAAITVGRAWTAALTVRPASFRGVVRLTATGHGRLHARAKRAGGSYRARLHVPATGRWTLTARAAGFTSRLGSIVVRKRAPTPVTFTWPTSIDLEADGSLLVVENGAGRVVRAGDGPAERRRFRPGQTVRGRGSVHRSDLSLERQPAPAHRRRASRTIASAAADIGPIAVDATGHVFYTTETQVFELAGGSSRLLSSQVHGPHGLAVTLDGSLLVSDTGNDRVLRIDPRDGRTTTLITTGEPRRVDVGADGSIYLVEAATGGVGRYAATGARLGNVGQAFNDPYDVEVAADGTVYVVDTALKGTIRRVAPNGSVSTISR